MSESMAVEVYEYQSYTTRDGWIPSSEHPSFVLKINMEACKPIEEIEVPSADWVWTTNWKICKMAGVTDHEGWEYASRLARLHTKNRKPKPEQKWSRARRRLWMRVMRREATVKSADLSRAIPKVRSGLNSIHTARVRIEDIMRHKPEAIDSEQMVSLVNSVYKNISDILVILDEAEKQFSRQSYDATAMNINGSIESPAVIKKLRNDVLREQAAIERALEGIDNPATSAGVSANSSSKGSARGNSPPRPFAASQSPSNSGRLHLEDLTHGNNNNHVSSSSSGSRGVVSGGAGAFNPALLSSAGASHPNNQISRYYNALEDKSFGNFEPEDGFFVERSFQDQAIAQKLVPIDEETVMQEIIDDRSNEIKKIHKGIVELNEMFSDLSRLVKEQETEIGEICSNVDESHVRTKEAFNHIIEANRLHQTGNCVLC